MRSIIPASIKWKIVILSSLLTILAIAVVSIAIVRQLEEGLFDSKKQSVSSLVDSTMGVLDYYHGLELEGRLTRSEAQELSKAVVRASTYGPDELDYFWINDRRPVMVMHPYSTDLVGTDVGEVTDTAGRHIFREVVRIAENRGSGYLRYTWQYYDQEERIEPKISYVSLFEPWGWILGTGIYIDDIRATVNRITGIILGIAAAAVLLAILLLYLFSASLSRPIVRVSSQMSDISSGDADLSRKLTVKSRDEIGSLAGSFNNFVAMLEGIISSIKRSFTDIASNKEEISSSSNETASAIYQIKRNVESTERQFREFQQQMKANLQSFETVSDNVDSLGRLIETQASAIEETSSSVEEMNASINNISGTAGKKQEESQKLLSVISEARSHLDTIKRTAGELDQRAEKIMEASGVISSISARTNLLSMNAAIEAAHAGDAGRGFAVVAEEIRHLAETAATNSKEIGRNLKESVEAINSLSELTEAIDSQFSGIEQTAGDTVESFQEITATMSELSVGTEEINRAITSLREVSSEVNENSSSIGSEVEGVASKMSEADAAVEQVHGALEEIGTGSEEISSAMNNLNDNIQHLAGAIEEVRGMVQRFRTSADADSAEPGNSHLAN